MSLRKIKITSGQSLLIITSLLAIYYLVCGYVLSDMGYSNLESVFYVEKVRIIFEGIGYKLKVMGLTSPIIPFFATFAFTVIDPLLAPVIASCLGTAVLFYMIAGEITKRLKDDFYLFLLLAVFLFHPGLLYTACSGKSIYLVLIFFYLFFVNLFRYYTSNTTFHVSIASICLVILLFCDYKFIWLTLFFIPLVFSISIQSLNLAEKESIFRMTMSFNSPSLRRKLINKTFALYIILFVLPIASIVCYKLLNLTNANDVDYFLQSPYSTWTVLADRLNYDLTAMNPGADNTEVSLLITAKIIAFCPLIVVMMFFFRNKVYQVLTLLTPFAFVEFLHLKYDKTPIAYQYYLIFLVLAILCIIIKGANIKQQLIFKVALGFIMLLQCYTGYYFLKNSSSDEERKFIAAFIDRKLDEEKADEDRNMANYINGLPENTRVLVDDAVAYKIVAYTDNIKGLILPYQDNYVGAVESPGDYAQYILVTSPKNLMAGYTLLSSKYPPLLYQTANNYATLQKVHETPNWVLYRFL
ncbi:hypothetical protein [Mucilaginibacter auburnensis]|uniref:Dolichyl-phosphate-mannose-protein mannosyltransferase n=1 Tax=Mucilaginibacter auburnensis TaxID=1457233 RepID=A0A2H9VQ53_9SPHI|nr:hypothetical protein [Mucilaginibacter auburnensis]PJJ80445.1 hypothetical protein CLV57_3596 [Mucilaginibacter auburnensis]